jgi:hypothetical protein
MLLFNDNKNANIIPITVTQTEINIGAIQTSAVQTAFAEILPSDNATKPPKPTKSGFETEDPSTPTDISTTETIDPNPETPQPTEPPTELPTDDIPSTETPNPNETPEITPTSIPDPITLDGSGNDIVEFTKWKGPAVLSAAHDGDGDFVISNYTKDNQKIYTLLRKTGYYVGSLPLDFLSSEDSKSFNITASGTWELQIIPLELARSEIIPALIEGDGDDVVIIIDDHPEQLVVDASNASEAFMIVAFGDNGERNLLINATAPYNGTLTAPPGTTKLVITATGPWAIDITAR